MPRVTSCAFSGEGLRTLFVTTAGGQGSPGAMPEGGLFAVDTTTRGLPAGRVRLGQEGGPDRLC